ncbi:unnamed protein product [Penicillium salamii]|nr:unnamed protein product [Penicillium salamii]CAG8315172.1 unnamed protein product [Penicillium salamii]
MNAERRSGVTFLRMFISKESVKAAHIIPKKLDREQLAHLFGDEDWEPSQPQNALSLHHKVETLLNRGEIAIVPMAGVMKTPTEWRFIVLNESLDMDVAYSGDYRPGQEGSIIRAQDLDNRPLQFTSANRPLRRYLYMRFLISYLWAKRHLVAGLEQKVESKRFWPSAGTYLERSTM